MTISEILNKLPDDGGEKKTFMRMFILQNSQHDSFKEVLSSVFYLNFKGRINRAGKYEPSESVSFHADHLKANDWVFVDVDKDSTTISVKNFEMENVTQMFKWKM